MEIAQTQSQTPGCLQPCERSFKRDEKNRPQCDLHESEVYEPPWVLSPLPYALINIQL